MIDLKYRIDFVRLDGEAMPSSENIIDGSTCYIIDTGELYIYYKGTWYNSDVESGQSENQESENQQIENTRENIIENNAELVKTSNENIIEDNNELVKTDEITND